jgi:hypothetical protein
VLGREPLPALRVASRHEQVEQIARTIGMGLGLEALSHDLVDQPDPAPPEPAPRPIVGCRDADRHNEVEQAGTAKPLAITDDVVAESTAVLADLEGEHGASGNLEREALDLREEIHPDLLTGGKVGKHLVCG